MKLRHKNVRFYLEKELHFVLCHLFSWSKTDVESFTSLLFKILVLLPLMPLIVGVYVPRGLWQNIDDWQSQLEKRLQQILPYDIEKKKKNLTHFTIFSFRLGFFF